MRAVETIEVQLPGGFAPNRVLVAGEGPPLVFLHGLFGQEWPAYLDDLAEVRRVYAPINPGALEPDDLLHLDGFWDLVLYYDELFDALGLERIELVGHSYGGMVAAEIAATIPGRVAKLVLIDSLGLWRDDVPVEDHLLVSPERRVELLYHDPESPEVAARLTEPEDLAVAQENFLDSFTALASTAHFVHPIPERGLAKRMHRIKAPTLVIWGREDKLAPVAYAEEFASRLAESTTEIIDDAGHVPFLEQRKATTASTLTFLG